MTIATASITSTFCPMMDQDGEDCAAEVTFTLEEDPSEVGFGQSFKQGVTCPACGEDFDVRVVCGEGDQDFDVEAIY